MYSEFFHGDIPLLCRSAEGKQHRLSTPYEAFQNIPELYLSRSRKVKIRNYTGDQKSNWNFIILIILWGEYFFHSEDPKNKVVPRNHRHIILPPHGMEWGRLPTGFDGSSGAAG